MDVPNQSRFRRSASLTIITMLVLGGGLIGTLALSQQTQETRSRAAGTFTIGSTTYGSSVDNIGGNSMTCSLYTATSNGNITSVGAALGSADPYSSRRQYSFAVYSDMGTGPGTLLGKSGTGTVAGNSWNSLPLSAPVTAGLSYWLCYNNNNVPTSSYYSGWTSYNNIRYTVQSAKGLFKTQTFGTWPTTFGTPTKRYTANYSIYATGVTATATVAPTTPPTMAPTTVPTSVPTTAPVIPTVAPTTGTVVNQASTPTPTPTTAVPVVYPTAAPTTSGTGTRLGVNLAFHGIGKGGDSSSVQSAGNMTPLHTTRNVTVEVLNSQSQVVATSQGTVTYNATTGNFSGIVDVNTLAAGVYSLKVKSPQFLRSSIPGIITVTANVVTQLPLTTLVAGDINGDNSINVSDFNILMGCYSDLRAAANCTADNKALADLTDDGAVNQFDYNLFIRELNNRGGQ